jgi:hypothetical protein
MAPFIRLRGVAGLQHVAGRLLDRFSDIQCVMLMLAVISGSFDHEVAVNVLRELSSFCVQIRPTRGHTTLSLYPLCAYSFYTHVLRVQAMILFHV